MHTRLRKRHQPGRPRDRLVAALVAVVMAAWTGVVEADVIEFLSGAKAQGTVKKINKEAKTVDFDLQVSGRTLTRTYKYDQIHAVTLGEKRYVLNPMVGAAGKPADPSNRTSAGLSGSRAGPPRRSKAEVEAVIAQAGAAPPDWYESTPLDYPQSLDLSFPEPAPGGWNNQKNVGQYVWDIINPNAGRWRSGVRFMHHLLSVNKDNRVVTARVMRSLGDMYFRFFQDYARAAFWWRQAGVGEGHPESIYLAECYWRLGNQPMAEELLDQRLLYPSKIKLWGDMGQTRKAVELAEQYVRLGGSPHDAYILAADACRMAGQVNQAIRYYQKVIDTPATGPQKERMERVQKRAEANLEAIRLFEQSDPRQVANGAYRAKSLGYEGPIEVEVTVHSGRIEAVKVTEHKEKQYYSALNDVPRQIIEKQGVQGVDATSKATITAEAIINATAKALAQGAK
jgi:uncharacterized protein with FMN-binding domain